MRWQLLDQILKCDPGHSAIATKKFDPSEIFFEDHFPGHPIVPGVLQIELMAQLAGKCIALKHQDKLPVLGSVKTAKFYHAIKPSQLCLVNVLIKKIASEYALAEANIEVNEQKVSSAELMFGFLERKILNSENFNKVATDFLDSIHIKEKALSR
jgi:3-hydroxymyristoyl/3-hydroxydecanoyl-(acyl carrier protein) dehydratase